MKILMATSEFAPLASTGEIGDHVRTLALELKRLGHEVSVAVPLYRSIRESRLPIEPAESEFHVYLGEKKVTTALFETRTAEGIQLLLIRRDRASGRALTRIRRRPPSGPSRKQRAYGRNTYWD